MVIRPRNNAFKQPDFMINDGDEIHGGNFSQVQPDTVLLSLAGKNITIRGANLLNVKLDPAWTVEDCNTTKKSFCSHAHPQLIDHGLPVCIEMCQHVTGTDEIKIDGVDVMTVNHHEDTILGKS